MSTVALVILGKAGSGKSCLAIRLVADRFVEDYEPTMADMFRKPLTVDDRTDVVDIYDTAGIDDFMLVRDGYMRQGRGFLIVYSVTDKVSFSEVIKLHDYMVRVKDGTAPCVLVGAKADLIEDREVSFEEGRLLAESLQIKFLEASSLNGTNVNECFAELVREVRKAEGRDVFFDDETKKKGKPGKDKKGRCTII